MTFSISRRGFLWLATAPAIISASSLMKPSFTKMFESQIIQGHFILPPGTYNMDIEAVEPYPRPGIGGTIILRHKETGRRIFLPYGRQQ